MHLPYCKLRPICFSKYSEEISGDILFVLYKVSILQCESMNSDGADVLFAHYPKLLHLSLEALMKARDDDIHLNFIGLSHSIRPFFFFFSFVANSIYSTWQCYLLTFTNPGCNPEYALMVLKLFLNSQQFQSLGGVQRYLSKPQKRSVIIIIEKVIDNFRIIWVFLRLQQKSRWTRDSCISFCDFSVGGEQDSKLDGKRYFQLGSSFQLFARSNKWWHAEAETVLITCKHDCSMPPLLHWEDEVPCNICNQYLTFQT